MSKISSALKKKWGPMPAWVWLLGGGLLYYFYRKYSATSSVSGTGTGSVAPAAPTPQSPVVLSPGESVYDPNAGTLTNTPQAGNPATVGGGVGGTGGLDPTQVANAIAAAIEAALPPNQGSDSAGNTASTNPTSPSATPGTAAGTRRHPPKLTAPGAIRAPFGHHKPKSRAGYTVKGLGRGFWEYVPKRSAKTRGQHHAQDTTSKPVKTGRSTRARSATAVRSAPAGGRTSGRQPIAFTVANRHRTTVSRSVSTRQQPSRAHQRPRQPAVQQVVSQRRPASFPRQSPSRQEGGIAPRPSAPPPRTYRAPVPPPPRQERSSSRRKRK